ncbi:hypothetical protein NDU88_003298 [Pleurodeles waltl]|uniref:Uncharacterized protein n=1 Tax=Pleurodeles waltl TaxID=8319 RepID=A0AAV7SFD0_PLEWA|nr:hypothetical protein NDU88_003298 [Pleurodeles waltl]
MQLPLPWGAPAEETYEFVAHEHGAPVLTMGLKVPLLSWACPCSPGLVPWGEAGPMSGPFFQQFSSLLASFDLERWRFLLRDIQWLGVRGRRGTEYLNCGAPLAGSHLARPLWTTLGGGAVLGMRYGVSTSGSFPWKSSRGDLDCMSPLLTLHPVFWSQLATAGLLLPPQWCSRGEVEPGGEALHPQPDWA